MRGPLLFCLMLLLGLSIAWMIAVIASAFFLLNAALPVVMKSFADGLQTALLLEGFIALAIFLFLAVIFVCATNLGPGPGGLPLVSGSFILFEIVKEVLERSP